MPKSISASEPVNILAYGVKIKKIHADAVVPEYQTLGSVGFDFHAIEDVTIKPGQFTLIRTGLAIATPPGYMLMAAPRGSSYKNFGFMMPNSVGVIDQDYCGDEDEVKIPALNMKNFDSYIKKGTRFAQGIFVMVGKFNFKEVQDMGDSRGGWGSTGLAA